jgi:uncharacterized repeat protein (TIGR02543 family)
MPGTSVTASAVADVGYTFTNWTEGLTVVSTDASYNFTIMHDRALVANFTETLAMYTLTLSSDPQAAGTTSGGGTFLSGTQVTASAVADVGYTFINWTDGNNTVSTQTSYTFSITRNTTLVAHFALTVEYFTLTITAINGSVEKNPDQATYASGTSVVLTARANSGFDFSNWSGDLSGSANPITIVMNSNKNVTANFTASINTFSLNVTAVNGTVQKNPDQATYTDGSSVTLTAIANDGYTFVNWSGDATGTNNPLTVVMNSDKNITANFIVTVITYTLTVTSIHGTVLKDPDLARYSVGAIVHLTATPDADYTFSSWSGDVTGTDNPLTLVMNSDKRVTANFIPQVPRGPGQVDLGAAGQFVILTKSGITNVPTSSIKGDVGTSPISGSANGLTCVEVTGNIYSVDAAGPAPCNIADPTRLTAAIHAMELAYTNAAGRTTPDHTELGSGNISGMTLAPGLYKWSTNVIIPSDVTFSGGANDTWIMQISQNLIMSNGVSIHLTGGAKASNIVWQVEGQVTIGTTAHFSGIILCMTAINMQTGAFLIGKMFAQTAVTLQSNTIE